MNLETSFRLVLQDNMSYKHFLLSWQSRPWKKNTFVPELPSFEICFIYMLLKIVISLTAVNLYQGPVITVKLAVMSYNKQSLATSFE